MKTAISIPNDIFYSAERAAKRLRMSRSRLYTKAIVAYVEQNREDGVTAALNKVYEERTESALDPVLGQLQEASLPKEPW